LANADGDPEKVSILKLVALALNLGRRFYVVRNIADVARSIWSLTVPLNREDKQAVVAEVAAKVAQAQTMVMAEYRGIAVGDLTRLRAKAREQQVYLRVLKNTLVRRAVADTPFAPLTEQMTGPLIYGISEDAIAAAKVLHDFAKSNDKLVIRSGVYDGKVMDQAAVQALASIPSREELLAKLLGVMQAPLSGFARALAALSEKKQNEPQGEPA